MSILTLNDAKAHLNITIDDDDALIQAKIDAASDWIDLYTGISYAAAGDTSVTSTVTPPASVLEACRQLVAHLYQNREASIVGMTAQALPLGFLDLLAPYRAFAF